MASLEELEARFDGMHEITVRYLFDAHSEGERWQESPIMELALGNQLLFTAAMSQMMLLAGYAQ